MPKELNNRRAKSAETARHAKTAEDARRSIERHAFDSAGCACR